MSKLGYENLFDFQKKIFDEIKSKKNHALFLSMGTGKTVLACVLADHKYNLYERTLRTIVFCPLVTFKSWKDHFEKWTTTHARSIAMVKGRTPQKKIDIIEKPYHQVLIINYEILASKRIVAALMGFKPEMVFCDESHRIKRYSSICTREVIKISKTAKYKYLLSGTPITNECVDVWSQFLFLDGGETFGRKMTEFKARYMINENAQWCSSGRSNAFPKWKMNPRKADDFRAKLQSKSHRLKTSDVVELPELRTEICPIDVTPEQARHLKEVRNDLITYVDNNADDPLVVQNALTKLLRMNEITSGYLRLESGEVVRLTQNPRIHACMDLIEASHPHKVIVFCVFRQNYADLERELTKRDIEYARLTGDTPTDMKLKVAEEFNTPDGGPRVLIANTRAAGLGVNLKGARYKIYYSRNYSLDDYLQSQARNYRAGSIEYHDKVVDYHLVSNGTIDEQILEAVLNKKKFAENLTDFKKMLMKI